MGITPFRTGQGRSNAKDGLDGDGDVMVGFATGGCARGS